MYHRILWCLDKFDVHTARIKTNVETRRNSWRTYGETRLIKCISCEVLLQKLVHLTNLRIKFSSESPKVSLGETRCMILISKNEKNSFGGVLSCLSVGY